MATKTIFEDEDGHHCAECGSQFLLDAEGPIVPHECDGGDFCSENCAAKFFYSTATIEEQKKIRMFVQAYRLLHEAMEDGKLRQMVASFDLEPMFTVSMDESVEALGKLDSTLTREGSCDWYNEAVKPIEGIV